MGNRHIYEIGLASISLLAYCLAILYDKQILAPFIMVTTNDIVGQMNTLFQVQASIATLGIALISLMSGLSKDMVFGISISQYIMQKKPQVFTHKRLILLELFLIILSYITILFNFYNILVVNFGLSIIFIGLMVKDIFGIFYGSQYIRDEIREYCLSVFKANSKRIQDMESILNNIYEDINYSIEINNYMRLKVNLELLESIFEKHICDNNKEKSLLWENNYINICQILLGYSNAEIAFITIESVCNILKKNKDKKILLHIWDKIDRQFFEELGNIKHSNLEKSGIILKLHRYLYDNLVIQEDKQNNISSLNNFSSNIYYWLLKNNKQGNSRYLEGMKKYLFDAIDVIINYSSKSKEVILIAYEELLNYTKTLIDNNEHDAFKNIFKNQLEKNSWNANEIKYILKILIYIYYLALKEELAKDNRDYANKILSNLKREINNFMVMLNFNKELFSKDFFEEFYDDLRYWERIPIGSAKLCFMDNVINEFLLFYIISRSHYNIEELIGDLDLLIKDNQFIFYNQFVGKNKSQTIKNYEKFLSLFYFRGNEHKESVQTIDKFENALIKVYKINEIMKTKMEQPTEFEIEELIINIKDTLTKDIRHKLQIFYNGKPQNVFLFNQKALTSVTYTAFLNEESKYIQKKLLNYVVRVIVYLTRDKTAYKDVTINSKNLLNEFFELIETTHINVDTLIGYRDWFYGMERQEDFKKLEDKMNKVKADGMSNIILAINSRSLYLNLLDINVRIEKLTESEIIDGLETDQDGKYLYTITNDISLPFTKDELIDYLSNAKRVISVDMVIEYGYKDNGCGVGINIIQRDE